MRTLGMAAIENEWKLRILALRTQGNFIVQSTLASASAGNANQLRKHANAEDTKRRDRAISEAFSAHVPAGTTFIFTDG